MVRLKAEILDLVGIKKAVVLNSRDAVGLNVSPNDRVRVTSRRRSASLLVEVTGSLVQPGRIGLYKDSAELLEVDHGEELEVDVAPTPRSVEYIRKKIRGGRLTAEEIKSIVEDVVNLKLSDIEIAGFLFAEHYVGMHMDEVEALTRAMVETGDKLELPGKVVDKHSIGGVPGNKITLLVVPIIASTGLLIPKTSSRAITSPSGTADTMSVLANVEFSLEEVKEIVRRVGGCIVWGGSLNIAPADDIFIRVEHPLRLDPKPQMMASIMAKKLAVGAQCLVLDVPVGRGTKVEDMRQGEALALEFIELGRRVGIHVRAALTYGGQPVGRAVGPALEAREALMALMDPQNYVSRSLIEKSIGVSGLLLELAGVAGPGRGYDLAKEVLYSGRAYEKFKEIIEAQGGDPNIKPEEVPVGEHRHVVKAPADGFVTHVDNSVIAEIARAAGAPVDKGAGVVLRAKVGHVVRKGDPLLEVYAERGFKLQEALAVISRSAPVIVEGMLLKTVPGPGL